MANHWNQTITEYKAKFDKKLNKCATPLSGSGRMGRGGYGADPSPTNRRGWHCGRGKNGSANDTHISFGDLRGRPGGCQLF